jgi:hypothetical protein
VTRREELLKEADEMIVNASESNTPQGATVRLLCSIACTLLAAEMRHTVGIAETIRSYEGGGKDE